MQDTTGFEPAIYSMQSECLYHWTTEAVRKRVLKILFTSIHIYVRSRMNSQMAILSVIVRIYSVLDQFTKEWYLANCAVWLTSSHLQNGDVSRSF